MEPWKNWGGPSLGVQKANLFTASKTRLLQWPFFAKTGAALTNRSAFASLTEWQDPGEHGCWLKVSGPACMLPIFAKAPCCLELFGCCCRRLSQHGVGEVLIPLRHCWRDAFFCVCVGSGWFCHDWASHCSVFLLSFDGLLVFGFPSFAPLDS